MNTKKEPKPDQTAPQGNSRQTPMVFQEIMELMSQKLETGTDAPFSSEQSTVLKQSCKLCHHQKNCILFESATDFALNMVSVTEDRSIINLFEPLRLFCAHTCGGFARIPDPLIP